MTESIPAVLKMKRWDEIEPSIIDQLNNPDLNRARQAAETLSKYGSSRAEAAMWERMRGFHQQWADRGNELNNREGLPRDATDAKSFQYGLVLSLAQAQGWLLSDEQVSELEQLTLGSQRDNVKQYHWKSTIELSLITFPDGQWRVDGLNRSPNDLASLREKLRQYPRGTKFRLRISGQEDRLVPVVNAINETALASGLAVEVVH